MPKTQNFTYANNCGSSYGTTQITTIKKPDYPNNLWIIYILRTSCDNTLTTLDIYPLLKIKHTTQEYFMCPKQITLNISQSQQEYARKTVQEVDTQQSHFFVITSYFMVQSGLWKITCESWFDDFIRFHVLYLFQ